MRIKLSKWAKQQGISYTTAYRWWKAKKIDNATQDEETGTIMVEMKISNAEEKMDRIRKIMEEE